LYIVPEVTATDKILNGNALQAATAIKAQKLIDVANGKANIKSSTKSKMLLCDWLQTYADLKQSKSKRYQYELLAVRKAALEVSEKTGKKLLSDVDKDYCISFIEHLKNGYCGRLDKPIKQVTANNYCLLLNGALNKAVREGLINKNPYTMLDADAKISKPESQRIYLTTDEVKSFISTDYNSIYDIKNAFLFSCFTGLRLSDVKALTWGNIARDREEKRLEIKQQKTQRINSFVLPKQALKWMPEQGKKADTDNVFNLPCQSMIDRHLKIWATDAKIDKNVSFHTARHTFATMMLTLGADLYTVSKLMGTHEHKHHPSICKNR
jgi:integrase